MGKVYSSEYSGGNMEVWVNFTVTPSTSGALAFSWKEEPFDNQVWWPEDDNCGDIRDPDKCFARIQWDDNTFQVFWLRLIPIQNA